MCNCKLWRIKFNKTIPRDSWRIIKRYRYWHLILNAGWGEMSPFISLSDDEIEQHVNINAG